MLKKTISLLFIFVLKSSLIWATGPSYVNSIIIPLAKNDKGEILCRTSFEQNNTGGHYLNYIDYGLCVLTADSIIEYPVYQLKGEEMYEVEPIEVFQQTMDKWQNWLNGKSKDLTEKEKELIDSYKFNDFNLTRFLTLELLSGYTFNSDYLSETNYTLKSLQNGKVDCNKTEPYNNLVIVTYDFGNIILTQNIFNWDEVGCGYEFYLNESLQEAHPGMGYEMYNITGILFKK